MRLLIAYDGSPAAQAAITSAGARFAPAESVVLTVREPELRDVRGAMARVRLPDEVIEKGLAEIERRASARAQATVDDGVRLARDVGFDDAVGVIAAGTRPWREIERAAQAHGVDLVICGTHRHPPIGRAFLGSTASSLLHHAPCSVLVTPGGGAAATGTAIVAYDGSESASTALRFAAEHLRHDRLLVTYVWRSPVRHALDMALLSCLPSNTVHDFVADFDEAYAADACDTAERGAAEARSLGATAEARTIESGTTPWRALLRVAMDEQSTLIVAGAERSGTLTSALGSVSSGLVHHAARAMLIVPLVTAPTAADSAAAAAVSSQPT